ncbi:MAG: AI-2E family transporter [Pirellulaceae bacterium]|nr:MAG: AI-2E family transporter [Pirellulaceae bacterium]
MQPPPSNQRLPFYLLLAAALMVGVLLVHIVRPFLFSILSATVLAVLFQPVYDRLVRTLGGRRRLSAGLLVVAVVLVLLVPIGCGLVLAGNQVLELGEEFIRWAKSPADSWIGDQLAKLRQLQGVGPLLQKFDAMLPEDRQRLTELITNSTRGLTGALYEKTQGLVANLIAFFVGLVIMAMSLYYFLADGPAILNEIKALSPLDDEDEELLIQQFGRVCRGVVLGTVVSGLAQGILAGIGFAMVGIAWFWLAAVITVIFAFIPFLGAAAVWLFVVAVLLLDQRYGAALFIAIYGTTIVSASDNLIKAYVIGGESRLHPLIVLVTVLGALQYVGLWGIFVGPMIAALFYSLLVLVRKRMNASYRDGELAT